MSRSEDEAMTMCLWKLVTRIPIVIVCLLTACGAGTPSHAETHEAAGAGATDRPEHKESKQKDRPRVITIDLDAKQPLFFHRNLRALNRAFAVIEPGEQVQLRLKVPRDDESRSIATRTLRVDEGKITFASDGEAMELDASGEHSRVNADRKRSKFRFKGRMHLKLFAAKSVQGEKGVTPEAALSPNAVEAIGDAAKEGVGWSELRLPLAVEVKDDHYIIMMMVEKSEDFKGAVEWHMPAYK